MKTVALLRLEHSNGYGLYHNLAGKGTSVGGRILEFNVYDHPDPYDDWRLTDGAAAKNKGLQDYFYAFKDEHQLLCWVDPIYFERLANEGIKLAVYICEETDVIYGKQQTIFCEHISKTQHEILEYFQISA